MSEVMLTIAVSALIFFPLGWYFGTHSRNHRCRVCDSAGYKDNFLWHVLGCERKRS